MRAGARDFLMPPICVAATGEALQTIRTLLREEPLAYSATEHIYSFVPAKPGVGATTVAMNTSAALALVANRKVLLADLDLTCGMIRFFLKLPQDLSIVDALARAAEMDVSLWPQLVTRKEGVDVLHSGSVNPHAYLDPHHVSGLIDFARSAYTALCFDMSGNMERHSMQVMQESKRVFLVCNPEPGSLFLGREKLEYLRTIGLADRVSVILNRADQLMAVPADKVCEFLGVPLAATFSEEPASLNRAIGEACSVMGESGAKRSKLAREYRTFAQALVDTSRQTAGNTSAKSAGRGLLAVA
jgi:pilus assembly protein CpaE